MPDARVYLLFDDLDYLDSPYDTIIILSYERQIVEHNRRIGSLTICCRWMGFSHVLRQNDIIINFYKKPHDIEH